MIHESAIVEDGAEIGEGTRIWHFVHVRKGAKIGKNCNIGKDVYIDTNVEIGNNCKIQNFATLYQGLTVGDDVFIGPNVTFTNDKFPRSKQRPDKFLRTIVRKGASIGANATILPGLEIGTYAMVGAGAVVLIDVPAYAVVAGNPAKIIKYIESESEKVYDIKTKDFIKKDKKSKYLYNIKNIVDMRGDLFVLEFIKDVPFTPQRFFTIYNVPSEKIRGQHAHKKCHQFLICIKGSVNISLDDGKNRYEYILNTSDKGLYIPPMVWSSQYNYSKDAVLLVFASHNYDEKDYIRNYEEWKKKVMK